MSWQPAERKHRGTIAGMFEAGEHGTADNQVIWTGPISDAAVTHPSRWRPSNPSHRSSMSCRVGLKT